MGILGLGEEVSQLLVYDSLVELAQYGMECGRCETTDFGIAASIVGLLIICKPLVAVVADTKPVEPFLAPRICLRQGLGY